MKKEDIDTEGLVIDREKKEEQRLKLLESVITNTTDAILITEAEPFDHPGPKIIYVNKAFTRMTGYTAEEIVGKTPRILQGPKTDRTELTRMRVAMDKWETCDITVINYKKNGEEFWIQLTITPVADETGWFTHWIFVERDVTERMKIQHELKQIFELAPDVICTIGTDGYFKKINPAMCKLLEYTEEQLLVIAFKKIIHPDDQVKVMTQLEISNKGTSSYYFENRCVTKTGKLKWLAWTSTPATEDGLIFTVAKDITDKKELENLLNKATNLAGIGGWNLDLKNNTVFWSDMTRNIYEVDASYQPNFKNGLLFFNGRQAQNAIIKHIQLSIKKCLSFDVEMQITTAKGNLKWVRIVGEPEFVAKQCTRISGSFQDIDVRKKAEILAKEALEEKKIILESIGDAFFAVDRNWIVTYWNKIAEVVFHRSKAEMIGRNIWDIFSAAIDSESFKSYHLAIATQQPVHFEDFYEPLHRWYEISAYPSDNGLSVYFKDVTERKLSKNLLIDSEKRYSELFQYSPTPKWVYDQETLAFLDVNNAAIEHYGYTREEFLSMTIKDIRPEGSVKVLDEVLEMSRGKKNFIKQGVFSHRTKEGKLIEVDIQSNPMTFKGRPAKVIIANDITERLAYIKAIEEQNEKLREISWLQSHVVRAPLARILGLVGLLSSCELDAQESVQLLEHLQNSANELDNVIVEITRKTKH